MHQNAPFRRRTCQFLFCGGDTAHCPGPTPTGEWRGAFPRSHPSVPLHLIATNSILAVVLPHNLLEELTQGRHLRGGGNCPVAPPSKAKQKIICSAKLPHTRRHILARRLPCLSIQFVCTSMLPPSSPNLMLHF